MTMGTPEFMGQQPSVTSAEEVARAAARLYTSLLDQEWAPRRAGYVRFSEEQAFELTCVIMKAEVDSL